MRKLFIIAGALALPTMASADTTFECASKTGEHVLFEFGAGYAAMTAKNTGDVEPVKADRHVFPSLAPFLEKTPSKLTSLTHVAEMTSHFLPSNKSETAWTQNYLFVFAKVTIDLSGDDFSRVLWDLDGFGEKHSFEVVCDQKGKWTSID